MKTRHLGDAIHDLLDGRLRGDRAYTAMAHLGECEECAARFHELRAARDALNSSQAGIDMRFARQLLDRDRIAQIAATEDSRKARVVRRHRRMPLVVAAACLAVLTGAAVTAAWQAGAPQRVSLEFAQPREGVVPVAYMDTQSMRNGELRSWIHPDFATSSLIPVEANVVQRGDGQQVLVARVLAGLTDVMVVQQHGRLDHDAVAPLEHIDVAGADAYVVESGSSTALVWQTGDVVVAISCGCTLPILEQVAQEFPSADEPGFVDRVTDGFGALVDALTN